MRLTLSHTCCRSRPARDVEAVPPEAEVATSPSGPAAATEAFAWMNRQITWQSLLADLEVMTWCSEADR